MTNEEINEAIAKHTGWKQCDCGNKDCLAWFRKESWEPEFAPLFATNLNAMQDAEKMSLSGSTAWLDFAVNLMRVLEAEQMSELNGMTCILQATARQRAEAFLRTVGKWKE